MDEIEKKAEEIRAEIDGAKGEAKEAKTKAESVEVKMTEIETGFSVKTNDLKKEIDQLNEGINDLNKKMAEGKMETKGTFVDTLAAVYEIVNKEWDKAPDSEYFNRLLNISQNSIIWGGNYFDLPPTRCFIVWDKIISEDFSLAMAELAWTSFDALAKIYKLQVPKSGKMHPTQKPIKLYEWIFKNYAKPNDKILDTHLGSGSSRIAADKANLPFVGCELDADYFYASVKRFKEYSAQTTMF